MNHIEAFHHYLEIEERRSPGTVRAYVADVQMLRNWLDDEFEEPCAWEEVRALEAAKNRFEVCGHDSGMGRMPG